MSVDKLVQKRLDMNTLEIVRFQIMIYCAIRDIQINHTQLKLLALLGVLTADKKIRVTKFCQKAVERKILGSTQAVSTCLYAFEQLKLFIKEGTGKKLIYLNPDLKVLVKGNVVINLLLVKLEAKATTGDIPQNSKEVELTA